MSKIETIAEQLSNFTVLEISELVKFLESKWGVSAAPVAVAGPANVSGGESVVQKDEFQVLLVDAGASKINVIKEVRAITGLGLVEAKALVDGAPKAVKESVKKDEAEKIKAQLEAAGAKVELK